MPWRRLSRSFLLLALPVLPLVGAAELAQSLLLERTAIALCITLVLVVGLQEFMGNAGILSFAHIGFMGVGAYAAAVITSFALLVVLHTLMLHWSAVTNGPRALFGLPKATKLGLAAGAAIAVIAVALLFRQSRTGLLLRASRDDEVAAAAMGARIPALRWRAFVLSAAIVALGGGLRGHFITSLSPKAFCLMETFVVIGMLVIGGTATVSGAVLGTFVVTIAFEGLRATGAALDRAQLFAQQIVGLTEVALACAMILFLILRPGGLLPRTEIGALRRTRQEDDR